MSHITRIASATALAFAAVALPVVTAGPAHATVEACKGYLEEKGYDVTYEMEQACVTGSHNELEQCAEELKAQGVWRYYAYTACEHAAMTEGRLVDGG
ncbi:MULTISPECIES: hypothetical protein [Saccharothrix]|uniref:hypothetical protein n=1 Tax=Saccharothrix TaxID=2071 RepID=UPI00093FAE3D|nr:hypothetical protein [Saccharothrix sp. CB00851]OKI26298.1 hypothetical protein A6A25_31890 [Saccharothrix sp. CB00851]